MADQVESGSWQSSGRGDKAWKDATELVASRNADARKRGKREREEYERGRLDARRAAEAKRHVELLKRHKA